MPPASPTAYRLDGLDLPKLLRRVSAGSLSPEQAEQLVREVNRSGLRLFRSAIVGVVGLVFLGVGLLLLRFAGNSYAEKQAFTSRARQTTGTVIALNRHTIRNKRPTYAPVVSYQVAGRTYRLEGLATSPAAYTVGETVTVEYVPAKPEAAQLQSFTEQWLLMLIAGGVGGLLTLIGLGVVWSVAQLALRPTLIAAPTMQHVLTQVASGQLSDEAAYQHLLPGRSGRNSSVGWVLFVGVVGTGLFFSVRQIGQSVRLVVSGQRTEGTVISFVHSGKGAGAAPLIRYQVAGQAYECVGGYATSPDEHQGDSVPVLYDPANPADARPRTFGVLVSGPLFGLLIVSLLMAVPLYARFSSKRRRVDNVG